MMPHSFLFGHLGELAKVTRKGNHPPDLHNKFSLVALKDEFPELASAGLLYVSKP